MVDARVAHQPERHVQDVNTEIDQWTATGKFLAGEPTAEAGNARPTHPERLGVVDLAQVAVHRCAV